MNESDPNWMYFGGIQDHLSKASSTTSLSRFQVVFNRPRLHNYLIPFRAFLFDMGRSCPYCGDDFDDPSALEQHVLNEILARQGIIATEQNERLLEAARRAARRSPADWNEEEPVKIQCPLRRVLDGFVQQCTKPYGHAGDCDFNKR
jgi:hypothetical protein